MVQMQLGHGSPVTIYDSSDQELGTTVNPLNVEGTVTESAPTSTTIATAGITLSATEVLILPVAASRLGASIENPGTNSIVVYIGATGVTAANGFDLAPGAAYNIDFPNCTAAFYGLAASGNPVVKRIVLT